MATIKSFTDIPQSKMLLELGLSPESADMFYSHKTVFYNMMEYRLFIDEDDDWHLHQRSEIAMMDTGNEMPAWSLSALLDILPFPQLSKDKLGSGKVGWMVSVYPNDCRYDSCWHNNPVDACYEMILKLHELKML